MYATSTAQGDSVRQIRVKTSVCLPYDTGWCGTQTNMVRIFWVLIYVEWTRHYREANSLAGRAMAADKVKFCFKTSLPLENSSREAHCWGRMFRWLTTEHRPHSTCPAHSYQQPEPTAPPPLPLGEVSFVEQTWPILLRNRTSAASTKHLDCRTPPPDLQFRTNSKHSVYQTSSALRSRIHVHLQNVSFIVSLSHDLRHSCPARTKDKGTTWYTVRGQTSILTQIRNVPSCATFAFVCFIIRKPTGLQKYVLGTGRIF